MSSKLPKRLVDRLGVKVDLADIYSKMPIHPMMRPVKDPTLHNYSHEPVPIDRVVLGSEFATHPSYAEHRKTFTELIDPKKKYLLSMGYKWVNHKEGITKAWKKNGDAGIKQYITEAGKQYKYYIAYVEAIEQAELAKKNEADKESL